MEVPGLEPESREVARIWIQIFTQYSVMQARPIGSPFFNPLPFPIKQIQPLDQLGELSREIGLILPRSRTPISMRPTMAWENGIRWVSEFVILVILFASQYFLPCPQVETEQDSKYAHQEHTGQGPDTVKGFPFSPACEKQEDHGSRHYISVHSLC
jgi:hypothetical protein